MKKLTKNVNLAALKSTKVVLQQAVSALDSSRKALRSVRKSLEKSFGLNKPVKKVVKRRKK